MWLLGDACNNIVCNAWNSCYYSSPALNVFSKINKVQDELKKWNKETFGQVDLKIKLLEAQLRDIQNDISMNLMNPGEQSAPLLQREQHVRHELNMWYDRQEVHWAQKARQLWMVNGERNTAYFHQIVRKRRIQNSILKLRTEQDRWIDDYEDIERHALAYFQRIYALQ